MDRKKCTFKRLHFIDSNIIFTNLFKIMKNQESILSILFALVGIIVIIILTGSFLFAALFGLMIFFLTIPAVYPLIRPKLKLKDLADNVFYARTEDNWYIALHYHEARYPRKKALPVILCHGLLKINMH
jgi:hypothetical protein